MNLCKALIHQSVRIRHRAEGNQSAVVVVVVERSVLSCQNIAGCEVGPGYLCTVSHLSVPFQRHCSFPPWMLL